MVLDLENPEISCPRVLCWRHGSHDEQDGGQQSKKLKIDISMSGYVSKTDVVTSYCTPIVAYFF